MKAFNKNLYMKEYRQINKEAANQRTRNWRNANYDKIKKQQSFIKYHGDVNPHRRFIHRYYRRMYAAFKSQKQSKCDTLVNLLGCTFKEFIKHIESQFNDGMTWDNYGKWHVDHIIPCKSFDLAKLEEQQQCFNYKNTQPLWAKDNRKKW